MSTTPITRTKVVQAIMVIRNEWETAACGDPLTKIDAIVGYLLFDVFSALGLEHDELRLLC